MTVFGTEQSQYTFTDYMNGGMTGDHSYQQKGRSGSLTKGLGKWLQRGCLCGKILELGAWGPHLSSLALQAGGTQ